MNEPSVLVELDQIQDNPYQQRQDEDTSAIAEIAVSIFRNGLLQVPSARRVNGHYELVFGHTRRSAYRLLATQGVPAAEIKPDVKFNFMPLNIQEFDDRQMFELATVENIKRRDLKPTEKARAIQRYMEEFKASSKEAGELFGMNDATVRGLVRLLDLPDEVHAKIDDGTITQGTARSLLSMQKIAPKETIIATVNKIEKNKNNALPDEVIAKYRDTDLIVSSSGVGGYWLAADMDDIEIIAEEYVKRSREMEEKARNLRKHGAEKFGPQIPLFKVN